MACAASIPSPPTPAAAGRFTLTRTLPDGRTETRSVTLDELKAMTRPASASTAGPAPVQPADTVVFQLPNPVPDRETQAAAPTPPTPSRATPVTAAALERQVPPAASTRPTHSTPSAAAILAALSASRGQTALHAPLMLQGGWTLADRDDNDAEAAPEAPVAGFARSRMGKSKKGDKPSFVRDGKSFGQQGRLYVYAGVKNRGVGLNLTDHNGDASGGWGSDGVSYDRGGFAGQRSAGLGWRQGDVSTSLGWVYEKNNIKGMYGAPAEKDDRVSLTFSWRPSTKPATAR